VRGIVGASIALPVLAHGGWSSWSWRFLSRLVVLAAFL
jgi:hypothetical protein